MSALLFGLLFAYPLPLPARVPAARVVELGAVRPRRRYPWALAALCVGVLASCHPSPAPQSSADAVRTAAPVASAAVVALCRHAGQAVIDDAATGLLDASQAQARLGGVHAACRQVDAELRGISNGAH